MRKIFLLSFIICTTLASVNAQTTYKDVAPIFYKNCASCHNPNGVAPMSLLNYSQTVAYKLIIKTYIMHGIMPPWPPDTTYHKFFDQRVLSASDMNKLVNWIDSGARAGDTALAPPAPSFPNRYMLHGRPDLVLKIPTFISNAGSNDAYDCFVMPTGLTQDRIIAAFEIVPGNRTAVHHVLMSMDTSGTATSDLSGVCYTMPGSNVDMGGYVSGAEPMVYPNHSPLKMGFRLKANSNIVFVIHYAAGTAGKADSTCVRLFFYPVGTTNVREVHTAPFLENTHLQIPADSIVSYTAIFPRNGLMPRPISLFAAFPHQHKIGVNLVNYAFSGKDTIPLIRINNWDFRWQGFYVYPKLVVVPAGYTLFASHTYNNTTSNQANPFNPPQNIVWGHDINNEMLYDNYQYIDYQDGDDTINISNMLQNDSLVLGIGDQQAFSITSKTYPNPFNNYVNIGYSLNSPAADVSVTIYNMYGSKVKTVAAHQQIVAPGYYEVTWNGSNDAGAPMPAGVYLYMIDAGKATSSGKLILVR